MVRRVASIRIAAQLGHVEARPLGVRCLITSYCSRQLPLSVSNDRGVNATTVYMSALLARVERGLGIFIHSRRSVRDARVRVDRVQTARPTYRRLLRVGI